MTRLLDSSKYEKDKDEELFFWNDTFQECVDRIRLLRPNTRQEVLFTNPIDCLQKLGKNEKL